MFDTFLGLPLHVLLIHAAVTGVPLIAVGCLAVAARPSWRERFLPWAWAGSVAALGLVWATIQSGKRLSARLPDSAAIDRHAALANTLLWLVLGLCAAVGIITLWSRYGPRQGTRSAAIAFRCMLAGLLVTASAVTVQVVRTGHSGSDAVWGPIVDATHG